MERIVGAVWKIGVVAAGLLAALVISFAWAVPAARAEDFVVTTTADTDDGCDANCSLREAIAAAAANPGVDGIAFSIPATDAGCSAANVCTLVLESPLPPIADADGLIINGCAAQITIHANGQPHGLVNTGTLELCNLTISGVLGPPAVTNSGVLTLRETTVADNAVLPTFDEAGAAIKNEEEGTLDLVSSTVRDNTGMAAGGITNLGALTIGDSTIAANSSRVTGGIMNRGTLDLAGARVEENEGGFAGGIANLGPAVVRDSTLSGNSGSTAGGLLNVSTLELTGSTISDNQGGGVVNYAGATLENSTLSGNRATSPGAGFANDFTGQAELRFVTIVDNETGDTGGGLAVSLLSRTTLTGTIVAGNRAAGAQAAQELVEAENATLVLEGGNLIGHDGLATAQAIALAGEGGGLGASDQTATSDGTVPTALDAILVPTLADNGGATLTHALVAGSPAVDAGTAACGTADQRGIGRPQNGACDLGAFERVREDRTFVVTKTADTADGTCDADCSLHEAMAAAEANAGADTILFDIPATDPGCTAANVCTIRNTGILPYTNDLDGLTIDGSGAEIAVTSEGPALSGALVLWNNGTLTLRGLTFAGDGSVTTRMVNDGTMTVEACTFTGLMAYYGGALHNGRSGTMTIRDSLLTGNVADVEGGAIMNNGTLTVANSVLAGNTGYFGGAIMNRGTATIENSTLRDNDGGLSGGAISNENTLTLLNSTLTGNRANGGGGVRNRGTLTVERSTLADNEANSGGGIDNLGTMTIVNSTLSGNRAVDGEGGGISSWGSGVALLSFTTLTGNEAAGSGGGVYAHEGTAVTLRNTLASGNRAGGGSGGQEIYGHSGAAVQLDGYNLFGHSGLWASEAVTVLAPGGGYGPSDLLATRDGRMAAPLSGILDETLAGGEGQPAAHALVFLSPAVNAGLAGSCPGVDQLGQTRPNSGTCDIGAYEFQAPTVIWRPGPRCWR